jgi:hypothetical protein
MNKKMTLQDLRGMYPQRFRRAWADPAATGNPNKYTRATAKGHIHKINPAARPSKGLSSHARRRNEFFRNLVRG